MALIGRCYHCLVLRIVLCTIEDTLKCLNTACTESKTCIFMGTKLWIGGIAVMVLPRCATTAETSPAVSTPPWWHVLLALMAGQSGLTYFPLSYPCKIS